MTYRAQLRNPGRIRTWPAFKISLDLTAAERSWLSRRAGLTGVDCEDHRLLASAVRNLVAQEMAKSGALQRAKHNEGLK